MIIEAYDHPQFGEYVNAADYVFADGMPLCKGIDFIYNEKQERIAGMDFMPSVIQRCHEEKLSIVFFGSTEEVLATIKKRMDHEFPDAVITTLSPPFGSLDSYGEAYIEQINAAKPHVVFVALGCPKQETWMAQHYRKINAVCMGVGAAFPIFAQTQSKAPEWMRKSSMEWMYRLCQEPGRLWRRYWYTNTKFLKLLFLQKSKGND